MLFIDATAAVVMVLAILIGAMAWQIRDAIQATMEYQKEILAELVYARYRPGDLNGSSDESSEQQKGQILDTEAQIPCTRTVARSAKA
jgi:hypothetical protein